MTTPPADPGAGAGAAVDLPVEVRRSRRRRRTVSARHENGRLVVLIPASFTPEQEAHWVGRMRSRLERPPRTPAGSDELAARARRLSTRHLQGRAVAASVRWVPAMRTRWASCTPATGQIRVSERLRGAPAYVLDYILLHEMAHLIVAGHGPAFWALLRGYPHLDRARGWLEGAAHAQGWPPPAEDDPDAADDVDSV